ncbi:MAG TPA: DNA polymerase [Dissulfurispiraceae bacterium]|nr:DNA polymerase [Dissulfurispiraceae bacterium]
MQLVRSNSRCVLCSLRDRRRVWSEAPDGASPRIAIFGEAPGRDEDREGKPFIGGSGDVLNWALASASIRRVNCFVGNVISCRPPNNEITSTEGADAIPLCRGGFFQDLDYLASTKCRTILALGATAMRAFDIEGSITKNRGSVYTYKYKTTTFTVIPTFHPSFIMRKHWRLEGGGTGDNGAAYVSDFRKAASIADEGWEALTEDFNVSPTVDQVEAFIDDMVRNKRLAALDTETTGLSENARVVVLGIASSASRAISVPFLDKMGISYFTSTNMSRINASLQRLFSECPLLFQNSFFDIPMLRRMGFTFNLDNVEDTLLIHHTLSPESEHNLGFIVSVYGKTPYWKGEFLNRTTSILAMDQLAMRTYNLRDCVVLHQVYKAMMKDIDELELREFYEAEVRPLLAPVMEMRDVGMLIDMKAMSSFRAKLQRVKEQQLAKLYDLGGIPREFNFDSDAEVRYFLFGEVPSKFRRLTEFAQSNERYAEFVRKADEARKQAVELSDFLDQMPPKLAEKTRKKIHHLYNDAAKRDEQAKRILQGKKYVELNALQIVHDYVKPIYLLKGYAPAQTDGGTSAIDAEGLLSYTIALNNRLRDVKNFVKPDADEIAAIEKLLTWLAEFSFYSAVDKLLSTYTQYKPDADGRIRPEWKMWGTATGRISSSRPNAQNLPKRKDEDNELDHLRAEVRDFFIARPGWKFISCDYVNLEVYILAYETQDPELLAVVEKGLNIHDLNTKALFDIDETNPHWKLHRAAAKIFQFGRLQYGGSDRGVYRKVMIKNPSMHLTLREFAAASARWMSLHPKYVEWHDALEAEVTATRRTKTAFGRLRIFMGNEEGIVREALSTRIQSPGASLVNRAMRKIYDERNKLGLKARFVCQVHDQLIMEAPDDEAERVRDLMVSCMEAPFDFRGVKRTVKVDPSIGINFGEL